MSSALSAERLRFLFRTEQGRIGRQDWLQGAALLAAPLALLTAGWFAIEPFATRTLDEKAALIDPMAIAAYGYAIVFAFLIMVAAASFTLLSMKRLREIGLPTMLGGIAPLTIFVDGAMHWMQPRVADAMSRGWVWGFDALAISAIAWTIWQM